MRAAQWPVWIALRAYRCGGSSGMAITMAHRIPVSTAGQHAGDHLKLLHLRACVPGRLGMGSAPAFGRNRSGVQTATHHLHAGLTMLVTGELARAWVNTRPIWIF